jgi:AcrR family transcriptional regulator
MVRPAKKVQIPNLQEVIKETAWKQAADHGASALSLRAIARELNITAPAIYNYFPSRDDLVTALIYDAYQSFGDAQIAARDSHPASDLVGRFKAVGYSYREWALTYPQRFRLIFGTPIPGYSAPFEMTFPVAARSLGVMVGVVDALRNAGKLESVPTPKLSKEDAQKFSYWKQFGGEVDIESFTTGLVIWGQVHGFVSLEVDGNVPPFGLTTSAMYRIEIENIARQFVKK